MREHARGLLLPVVILLSALANDTWARVDTNSIESTYAEHTRGVELARAGRHDEGLAALRPLLERFPDDYPLQRDYILILTWKGDCSEAIRRFQRVRNRSRFEPYFTNAVAGCGATLARTGEHDTGLDTLELLLKHKPGDYPLQRDIILITIWKGECENALKRFDGLRGRDDLEPYLIVPVSDCLLETNRPREALTLVREGLARHPEDANLRFAQRKIQIALRIDEGFDELRPVALIELASDESDQGLREWLVQAEGSARIAEGARLYARYFVTRSSDSQFDAGDLDRVGVGIRYRFNERWRLLQEFSGDTRRGGREGSTTEVIFEPYDPWRLDFGYTTYAEDIPLRARANAIEATRSTVGAEYSSTDYVWLWRGIANRYDFSDMNDRTSFFTTVGYAYEILPEREQRIYVEWYQSRNTRTDAPYFNPSRDRSTGFVHQTDFVFESRYQRHVDHLYLILNAYDQEGFGTHTKWGMKYEQDYDFDSSNSFFWGVAFNRNVYDGVREDETRLELSYRKRF